MGGHGRRHGFIHINQSKFKYFSFDVAHCWLVLSLYESIIDSKPGGYFFSCSSTEFLFQSIISFPLHSAATLC